MTLQFIPNIGDYYSLVQKNSQYKKDYDFKIETMNSKNLAENFRKSLFLTGNVLTDIEKKDLNIESLKSKYLSCFWLNDYSDLSSYISDLREYWVIFLIIDDIFRNDQDIPSFSNIELRTTKIFSIKLSEIMEMLEFKLFSLHLIFCFSEFTKVYNNALDYYNRPESEYFPITENEEYRSSKIPFLLKSTDNSQALFVQRKTDNFELIPEIQSESVLKRLIIQYQDYTGGLSIFKPVSDSIGRVIPDLIVFDLFFRIFAFDLVIFNSDIEMKLDINGKFMRKFFSAHPPVYGLVNQV